MPGSGSITAPRQLQGEERQQHGADPVPPAPATCRSARTVCLRGRTSVCPTPSLSACLQKGRHRQPPRRSLWLLLPDDRPGRAFSLQSLRRRLVPPAVLLPPVLRVSAGCSDLQVGGAPPPVPVGLLDKHHNRKVAGERSSLPRGCHSLSTGLSHQT